jgi:hypothetical protein
LRAGSATVPERDSSCAIPITHRSGLSVSPRFENLVPGLCLVFASNGPRRRVSRNTLFAHQLREVLAPISQELLVDVQPPAELALGLHYQVHVRVLLVGVQDHGVAVLREFLAGELPRRGQHLVRGRRRRHGKDDIVHEFRRSSRRTAVHRPPVLAGGEFQVPIIEQPLLLFQASDALTLVGLDLLGSSAADVREVSRNRTPLGSSAGHFHHDLRRMSDRARDLINLRATESTGHLRTCAPVTHHLEESRSIGRETNGKSSSQLGSPR